MKIYRFEKNISHRLECIKNRQIYLSRPDEFNDLEDCRISGIYSPSYDYKLYEQLKNCLEILYPENNPCYFPLPDGTLDSLKEFFDHCNPAHESFEKNLSSSLHRNGIVAEIRNYLRRQTGVCCFFQGSPTHPLMWAHYASNHTGFCIEYEVDNSILPIYEVIYASKLPIPSIGELLFCPEESLLKTLTTKSIEWSYEKEFRLIYLNEIQKNEKGKTIELHPAMRQIRIIEGAKFNKSSNADLLNKINLEIIPYNKFIGEFDKS